MSIGISEREKKENKRRIKVGKQEAKMEMGWNFVFYGEEFVRIPDNLERNNNSVL